MANQCSYVARSILPCMQSNISHICAMTSSSRSLCRFAPLIDPLLCRIVQFIRFSCRGLVDVWHHLPFSEGLQEAGEVAKSVGLFKAEWQNQTSVTGSLTFSMSQVASDMLTLFSKITVIEAPS